MPINLKTKLSVFLVAVLFFTAAFDVAHASFLDIIRALVTINPLEVSVETPIQAEIGKIFKVEAVAINRGEKKIENAKAEIFLPPELVLTQKDSVKEIGVIPGKREKKVLWSVKGEIAGDYIISVLASGELRGDIVSADASTKITLKEKPSPSTRSLSIFEIFFDMFRGRFNF